jgi:hypothetical protein
MQVIYNLLYGPITNDQDMASVQMVSVVDPWDMGHPEFCLGGKGLAVNKETLTL